MFKPFKLKYLKIWPKFLPQYLKGSTTFACRSSARRGNVTASIVILVGGSAKSIMHALLKTKNKLFLVTHLDTESKPTPNYTFSCFKKCSLYGRFLTTPCLWKLVNEKESLASRNISLKEICFGF